MGEPDLAGFDDTSDAYDEIDSDSIEHVRHSAYWAVSTGRGQDWEQPDRWINLFDFMEQKSSALSEGAVVNAGVDLEETDSRVLKALYRIVPGTITSFIAEITTRRGAATIEGPLQPLPQDVPAVAYEELAPAGPVAAGLKTLRQMAVDGGLFPPWLLGPNGGKIVYVIGLVMDSSVEWLMQGVQQRFPLVCYPGALPWLSRDLGIARGRLEPEAAFRRRLTKWTTTWQRAGVAFAIAEQVQLSLYPDVPRVHVIQHDPTGSTRSTFSTREGSGIETFSIASPSLFDIDSNDPNRPAELDDRDPRLWVVIEQPPGDPRSLFRARTSVEAVARDPNGCNGVVRLDGSTAPADQYKDFLALALQWRAIGTWIAGVFLYLGTGADEGSIQPDGSWHDPLNDAKDGNRIPVEYRLLYFDRYPGNRLPESPPPYEV